MTTTPNIPWTVDYKDIQVFTTDSDLISSRKNIIASRLKLDAEIAKRKIIKVKVIQVSYLRTGDYVLFSQHQKFARVKRIRKLKDAWNDLYYRITFEGFGAMNYSPSSPFGVDSTRRGKGLPACKLTPSKGPRR